MIRYLNATDGIRPDQLKGFFEGWPSPPTPETHLTIIQGSYRAVLALDEDSDVVVGFITAVSPESHRRATRPQHTPRHRRFRPAVVPRIGAPACLRTALRSATIWCRHGTGEKSAEI